MKRRYPGPLPFSYDDRTLFFGRDQEIEYLTTLIINNKTTVLHGRSGYGKSSLINAGLIPNLIESFACKIIKIRFYNNDNISRLKPRETFLKTIRQHISGPPYLDKIITNEYESAWRYFKKLQTDVSKIIQEKGEEIVIPELSYILIFDHFEELFTYPTQDVNQFAKELREVVVRYIPEEYQQCLKEIFKNKAQLVAHKDELSILDKDIPLKVVFSLRSDQFNNLTYLVPYIPDILNNIHKIERMTPGQVRQAILKPALVDNGFISPPFEYDDKLVNDILNFLQNSGKGESLSNIEVFEMQIICLKLEDIVVEYHSNNQNLSKNPYPIQFTKEVVLNSSLIKDRNAPYAEIIKNYYKETIASIKAPIEQLSARFLIETKLIDQRTKNRISFDTALVSQIGIEEDTIKFLIDKRIIRREINTVSGQSFEISHDSLVSPIINAVPELDNLNQKLAAFFTATIRQVKDVKFRGKIERIIYNELLDEKDNPDQAPDEVEDEIFELLNLNPIIIENKQPNGTTYRDQFTIKEAFRQAAQQSKAKYQQRYFNLRSKESFVAFFLLMCVIGVLAFIIHESNKRENRLTALLFLADLDSKIDNDSISNKDALILTKYIYDQNVLYQEDSIRIKPKFSKLFHSEEFQSQYSYYDTTLSASNLWPEEIAISASGDFMVFNDGNTDAEHLQNTFKVLDRSGNTLKTFEGIMYAYFLNNSEVALLAKIPKDDSLLYKDNYISNEFILFNCKDKSINTIDIKKGSSLFPPNYRADAQYINPYDSYRVRFTSSGNILLPFYQNQPLGKFFQKIKLVKNKKEVQEYPSVGTISISKDLKKFMTALKNKNLYDFFIYDENGQGPEIFYNFGYGDFMENGSLLFCKDSLLMFRDSTGSEQNFAFPKPIAYAYADGDGKTAIAQGAGYLYLVNRDDSMVVPYKEKLIGANFKNKTFITQTISAKNQADTIWRRQFLTDKTYYFLCPEGIQSMEYNSKSDNMLIYTKDNRLYLLNEFLEIRAGFQLTANDLYDFSENGNAFFYVRNEFLDFFNNDTKLKNVFDTESVIKSLPPTTNKKYLVQLKEKHKLKFIQNMF